LPQQLELELRLSRRLIWETRHWGMAFGMDAGIRGHRRASPPTMRIMIAYRKASTRMRIRGDGMHILSTSEVIITHYFALSSLSLFCDNVLRHPVLFS
jgi:hypothetical protein